MCVHRSCGRCELEFEHCRPQPGDAGVIPLTNLETLSVRNLLWLLVLIAVTGCNGSPQTPNIPATEAIVSIKASVSSFDTTFNDFEIPESDWASVLRTLRDAPKDTEPAKWEVAGNIEIDDGKTPLTTVCIYNTSDSNAFSIEQSDTRTYFRSSDTNATLNAVVKSYSNGKKGSEQ